jgi:hypothetical protein
VYRFVPEQKYFSLLVISHREGKEKALNNSSNQAIVRVTIRRPRERRFDEKHGDKYSLVAAAG